jgi:hypothetical protein
VADTLYIIIQEQTVMYLGMVLLVNDHILKSSPTTQLNCSSELEVIMLPLKVVTTVSMQTIIFRLLEHSVYFTHCLMIRAKEPMYQALVLVQLILTS